MKKFESLKSSKFEAFKSNVLNSPLAISGGRVSRTTWSDIDAKGNVVASGGDQWRQGDDIGGTGITQHFGEGGDMVYNYPDGTSGNEDPNISGCHLEILIG